MQQFPHIIRVVQQIFPLFIFVTSLLTTLDSTPTHNRCERDSFDVRDRQVCNLEVWLSMDVIFLSITTFSILLSLIMVVFYGKRMCHDGSAPPPSSSSSVPLNDVV